MCHFTRTCRDLSPDLTLDQVKRILSVAERDNPRDALVFKLMAGYGLSVGEIVGTEPRHWDKENRKWVIGEPSLQGLQIQDLDEQGIVVRRKMGRPTEKILLKPDLIHELREHVGKRTRGRIFELSVSRIEQLIQKYSKKAEVFDGKLRPQAFVDYYRKNQGSPLLSETVSIVEAGRHVGRKIDYPGLTYAPINEDGEVFLFAMMNLNEDLGFSVESIAEPFPDALVVDYRANRDRGVKKYIEFEFVSSNFSKHQHPSTKCDIIVCWEDDWKSRPPNLEVIELKTLVEKLRLRTNQKNTPS